MKKMIGKMMSLVLVMQLILSGGLNVYGAEGDSAALDAEATILRESLSKGKSVQGDIDEITTAIDLILTPAQLQHYSDPKHIYFVTDISEGSEVQEEIRAGIHNMLNQTVLHHIYFVPFTEGTSNNLKVNTTKANTPMVYSSNFESNHWNGRTGYQSTVKYDEIQKLITGVLDSKYRGGTAIPYRNKEIIVYAKKGAKINLDTKYEEARIHWITREDVVDIKGQIENKYTGVTNQEKLSKAFDETVQNIMQDTSKINITNIAINKMQYNETLPVGVELVDNKITLLSGDGTKNKAVSGIRTTGNSKIGLTINHEFLFAGDCPLSIKRETGGNYRLQGKMKYKVKYNNTGEINFLGGWISPIAGGNGSRFFIDKYVVEVKGEYPTINLEAYPKTETPKGTFSYQSVKPRVGHSEDEYQFKRVTEAGKDFVLLQGNDRYVDFEVTGKDLNSEGLKTQILKGPLDLTSEKIEAFEQKVKSGEWRDPEVNQSGGDGEVTPQNPQGLWIQRYEYSHIAGGVDLHNLDWKNKTILFKEPIATADDALQGDKKEDRKGYVKGYEQRSNVSPKIAHKNAFFAPTDNSYNDGSVREIRQMWGYFQLPKDQSSGEYYFAFFADDGVYAHIIIPDSVDGKSKTNVLVDSLKPSSPYLATVPNAKPIRLEAGVKYPIYIEYYNIGGLGSLEMFMRPKDKGAWTFRGGKGNKVQETDGTINLSRKLDECFSYSKVTETKDIKEDKLTGKVQLPDESGVYYVGVKASTKGGAGIETVMGPFIRIKTTTIVDYPELCSVDPTRQLQLALDIDVSDKAYVVDEVGSDFEVVVPQTKFTFKLKNVDLSAGTSLPFSLNSNELYMLKETPKVYAIKKGGAKSEVKNISTLGEYLKHLTIEKDGENIIITTSQQSLVVGGDYKDLLKATVLITVNVRPHAQLRANAYTELVKNHPTQIEYVVDVKTEDSVTGVVAEQLGVKEIKVQLLDKKIN